MKVVDRFKRRILDLAIRGKLVPQDPNDEPASELLARIRTEKAKDEWGGKGRKGKRSAVGSDGAAYEKLGNGVLSHAETRCARAAGVGLPERSEPEGPQGAARRGEGERVSSRAVEVPFELPDGWAWCRLGEIAEVQLGKMLDKKNTIGVPCPYLANASVRWGSFDLDDLKQMPFFGAEVEKFALKPGDVIMCEGGVPGRCAVWREETSCIKYQKALHRIRLHESSPEYVRYYFEAIHDAMFFTARFSGSTIHHLPRETLIQVPIPLPPLAEQKRIVARIEELFKIADSLGEAADGLEGAAKRLDKKILDLAIRGKLVPQDPTDEPASELLKRIAATSHKSPFKNQDAPIDPPFEIPKGWKWIKLKELGMLSGGHTPSMSNPEFWGGDILWVTSKDMKSKYITDTQMKVSQLGAEDLKLLTPGTILMCTRSGILRRTFPIAIARRKLTINQDQRALTLWIPEMAEYIYVVLKSLEPTILMNYKKAGTTVESIIWNKFIELPIPIPPLAEQKRIVSKVEELKTLLQPLGIF